MPHTTQYRYDLHGNIVGKTMGNGETVAMSYDGLNRVKTIEGKKPGEGARLYRYEHRYDLAGNVIHIREDYGQALPATWREITQEYDGAHRLRTERFRDDTAGTANDHGGNRDVSYQYDRADNRTGKEVSYVTQGGLPDRHRFTYNALNQLTRMRVVKPARFGQPGKARTVNYSYDFNGNRTLRSEGAKLDSYSYDYEQRLLGVATTGQPSFGYVYDYRTRRVEIGQNNGSSSTTKIVFSGGTSVQEYLNGPLSVEFIRGSDMGGGIGGILYSLRGGQPSFTHYNNRGDVVAKTDAASTLTYQAAYEAFGKRSEEVGSTPDRQKANTKDEDPTGLLNEGFRYRDLETGEFITRDPIGFVDGPNLYTYVRQNPWTRFDPEGLQSALMHYPQGYWNADVRNMQISSEYREGLTRGAVDAAVGVVEFLKPSPHQ